MPSPETPKFIKLSPALEAMMLLHDPRGKSWVRVALSLLDDPTFEALPDATKFHLIGLMMLVRRVGFNHLLNDEEYLRRKIGANSKLDLSLLLSSGFLIATKRLKTKRDAATLSAATTRHDTNRVDETKTRHETTRDDATAAPRDGVRVLSEFQFEDVIAFVKDMKETGQKVSGRQIENAGGLAQRLHESGKADSEIRAFKERQQNPPRPRNTNCPRCFGSNMETVAGKGARPCPECRA